MFEGIDTPTLEAIIGFCIGIVVKYGHGIIVTKANQASTLLTSLSGALSDPAVTDAQFQQMWTQGKTLLNIK